jgi:hypothetical protein
MIVPKRIASSDRKGTYFFTVVLRRNDTADIAGNITTEGEDRTVRRWRRRSPVSVNAAVWLHDVRAETEGR